MNFEKPRTEYYEGLKTFQQYTNQQDRLKILLDKFLYYFKHELEKTLLSNKIELNKKAPLEALLIKPLIWKDIGSGDGTFSAKVLEVLEKRGFILPDYEGIELNDFFVKASKRFLANYPNARITKGNGFNYTLHSRDQCDVVSGFNALYFVKNFSAFREDLEKALKPTGLGLFIQNTFFTDKAGKVLIGNEYSSYTIAIPTEVFFPTISKYGFELITNKSSVKDIENDISLSESEKHDIIITKKIIESMGGISIETDDGQRNARNYAKRILSKEYGGEGRYVSDNVLLIYIHPEAPLILKQIIRDVIENVRAELSKEASLSPRSNLYYDINTSIDEHIQPQLIFHNIVKTLLINNYVLPSTINNKRKSVLDVGCGQGGDIRKFYNAHADFVVGLDSDCANLYGANGAIARYEKLKHNPDFSNFPLMEFINADFTVPLIIEQQQRIISDKTESNVNLMKKYLNKKFDILNMQFVFHYFLQNEQVWNNVCNNINQLLDNEGYVIITCFDAHLVDAVLNENNGQFTQYININRESIMLHDIVRDYKSFLINKDKRGLYKYGNAINVHVGRFMSSGRYDTEYLVDKDFIITELEKKCNLKLIETDSFANVYKNIDIYVSKVRDKGAKLKMQNALDKLKAYYIKNSINEECLKITNLNKFYIFQKVI